jgi:signal transduction histidine kinase
LFEGPAILVSITMPTLTAVLDPRGIDLKARIVAEFFGNPFLECSAEQLSFRLDASTSEVTQAVADLERCGVVQIDDEVVLFEPAGDLYGDLRDLAAIYRSQSTEAREEVRQLESLARLEESLAVSREEVSAILDVMPLGVFLLDRYGSLIKANGVAHGYLDLEDNAIRSDICSELDLDIEDLLERSISKEVYLGRPFSVMTRPFRVQGSDVGIVVTLQDISDRKRLEAEAERSREAFFSMIRHELKRPLHSIDRFLNSVPSDDGLASHAQEAAGHLGGMIDDLLLLARIERDPLAVQPARDVTIGELFSGWDLGYRDIVTEKEITLTTVVDDTTVALRIDERRFQQAVGNVIDNAVKFTPRAGKIDLRAESRDARLSIVVDDSGPGIPPDQRDLVFDRFYQVKSGRSRSDGLGLGLAISAKVVEAHGGTVSVSDSPLGGARIVLDLPIAAGDHGDRERADQ